MALRRAAALDATEPDILRGLATVQIDLGDHDDAIATIEKAKEASDPTAAVGHRADLERLHSIALRHTGRLESALERARQAVALDRADAQSWMTLGDSYQALDRLDQAAKAYRRGWDLSKDDQRTAAGCLVGLSRALILGGKYRAALEAFESARNARRVAGLAKTYGAVPFNRAVALLRSDDEGRALRELAAAAKAKHPVPQAAELAGRIGRRRAREGSWLGFWFLDGGRTRRLAGTALLTLLAVTAVVTIADPAEVRGLWWVSADGNHRLVPLLAIAALLLLPIVTKLKVGGVEIEQPQPAVADVPELQPTSTDDIVGDLTTVVVKATQRLARAGASQGGPVRDHATGFDEAVQTAAEAMAKQDNHWVAKTPAT
jgi:tetratricopeptide (TPR) repeat protein